MPKQDKTFVRTGAGEIWVDDSLKDWPENDYRIFVGDLGKETTTEMLAKIFQPYKSFAKAKVRLKYPILFLLYHSDENCCRSRLWHQRPQQWHMTKTYLT